MKILSVVFFLLVFSEAWAQSSPFMAESSIYWVQASFRGGAKVNSGTGVLVAPGKILTNCHVVKIPNDWIAVVHRSTGRRFVISRRVKLGNFDACLLEADGLPGVPLPLADFPPAGERVWVYGYPRGIPLVSSGVVLDLVPSSSGELLILSVFCSPGSSGGAAVNARGQLVGLDWGNNRDGHCLSIPSSMLKPYIRGR